MKKILAVLAMLAAASAQATIYNDPTLDIDPGISDASGAIDIDSVTVSNDATTIYFAISARANPINTPDWGNYAIGLDTTAGGDTAGNAWARPISMSTGMDFWIGSWVNSGGGVQLWNWTGSAWNGPGAGASQTIGTDLFISVPLASLGLSIGNSFTFDVYTTGGGGSDSAVDALSSATPAITTWAGPYNTGANGLSYTVVPEPSTMALIAIAGGLLAARRMRRS